MLSQRHHPVTNLHASDRRDRETIARMTGRDDLCDRSHQRITMVGRYGLLG
jgi:hypothetical protein